MPSFMDPFVDLEPGRKMTIPELVLALRLDLTGEQEAISTYMAHASATDHPLAKKVLIDIANEERVHTGELLRLIQILTKDEDDFLNQGKEEVEEMRKKKAK